jgi:hypothetical protein
VKFALLVFYFFAPALGGSAHDVLRPLQLAGFAGVQNLLPQMRVPRNNPTTLQKSLPIQAGHLNAARKLLASARVIFPEKTFFL